MEKQQKNAAAVIEDRILSKPPWAVNSWGLGGHWGESTMHCFALFLYPLAQIVLIFLLSGHWKRVKLK